MANIISRKTRLRLRKRMCGKGMKFDYSHTEPDKKISGSEWSFWRRRYGVDGNAYAEKEIVQVHQKQWMK